MLAWIGNHIGVIEMAMSAALPLGFCAWQYWSMKRSLREYDKTSPDETGHPEG
jgi:hypothetical protein